MMIETTNHDWIRILILDVMSNLIDKVENENSNYKKVCLISPTCGSVSDCVIICSPDWDHNTLTFTTQTCNFPAAYLFFCHGRTE